jgi:predicted GNAT family acetyltransferase
LGAGAVAVPRNITTGVAHQGRGVTRGITAALCRSLLDEVSTASLNVDSQNSDAIPSYARPGFERTVECEGWTLGDCSPIG